jgi:hypothetical protein
MLNLLLVYSGWPCEGLVDLTFQLGLNVSNPTFGCICNRIW